jgi:GxxExxY protein
MRAMTDQLTHKEITERIIGCAFRVHSQLGHGFLERVYENAMTIELEKQGLHVKQQSPIPVRYDGIVVGEYFVDLLVEHVVVCELKAAVALTREHEAQLVNYLAATDMETGLLINFGRSVSVKRKFRTYRPTTAGFTQENPVNPEKSC